jgi:predicted DNA binding protein
MWTCKLRILDKEDIYTPLTQKHKVELMGYPISSYKKGNKVFAISMGILRGEEKNKKNFLKDLKKDRRIDKLEIRNDFITIMASHPMSKELGIFYDPEIIFIKPVVNSSDGFEYWEIASFSREKLTKLFNTASKIYNGKLLYMRESKLDDIYLMHIQPELTEMQKKVIQTAFSQGYYSYPRKTEIKKIAKSLNISFSTCQEHLRRAEIKLLPLMIKKL